MKISASNTVLLFLLLFLKNVLSKPMQKEILSVLLNSQSDANLQQQKQFIGTSVIGGLMWPVLLTLTVTAFMARVPDVLQRLLTGTGGMYRYSNVRRKRSQENEYLHTIMKSLLTAIDAIEKK